MALLGAVLTQHAVAEDLATPADAEFRTLAVEERNQAVPLQGSTGAVEAPGATMIPGYSLSQEELNLVFDSPGLGSGISRKSVGANLAGEHGKPPFGVRVVTWFKQRSPDFNFFNMFNAESSDPGLHVDVDTDDEELMLQYRVGF